MYFLMDITHIVFKNLHRGHAVFRVFIFILFILLVLGIALAIYKQPVVIKTDKFTGVILSTKEGGSWMPSKEQVLVAEAEMEKYFAKGFVPKLPIVLKGKTYQDLESFKLDYHQGKDADTDAWLEVVEIETAKYQEVAKKWNKYKRQYVGKKVGENQIIEIHFLTGDFENWQTQLIGVMDGGTDFLEVTFDLTNNMVTSVSINGES